MFYANKADKQHGDRCIATRGHGRSGFSAARLEHYLALDGSWLAPALADLAAQVPTGREITVFALQFLLYYSRGSARF